jgi:predicted Rossmann-fold nucleotide-binding protein
MDEFFEVLVGAQLLTHQKPIVLVNTDGYFDPLVDLVQHIVESQFAGEASLALFTVVPTPEDAIAVFKALLARQSTVA